MPWVPRTSWDLMYDAAGTLWIVTRVADRDGSDPDGNYVPWTMSMHAGSSEETVEAFEKITGQQGVTVA